MTANSSYEYCENLIASMFSYHIVEYHVVYIGM